MARLFTRSSQAFRHKSRPEYPRWRLPRQSKPVVGIPKIALPSVHHPVTVRAQETRLLLKNCMGLRQSIHRIPKKTPNQLRRPKEHQFRPHRKSINPRINLPRLAPQLRVRHNRGLKTVHRVQNGLHSVRPAPTPMLHDVVHHTMIPFAPLEKQPPPPAQTRGQGLLPALH